MIHYLVMSIIFSLAQINSFPLFRLEGKKLISDEKILIEVDTGEIFLSPDFTMAAVYDKGRGEVSIFNSSKGELLRVRALNPVVKFDDEGNFGIVEPNILRLRVFTKEGDLILDYGYSENIFISEPYYTFDIREKKAVFAFREREGVSKLLFFDGNNKIVDISPGDVYPRKAWISPKGELWLRFYSVKDNRVTHDFVAVYSASGKLIKQFGIPRVIYTDFTFQGVILASKHTVYYLEKMEIKKKQKFKELIINVKSMGEKTYILTGTPVFKEGKYTYTGLRIYELGKPESPVLISQEASSHPGMLEINGVGGLYIPEKGLFLKMEDLK